MVIDSTMWGIVKRENDREVVVKVRNVFELEQFFELNRQCFDVSNGFVAKFKKIVKHKNGGMG